MKPQEQWEVEFESKFGTIKHRGFPQQAIKSFIHSLLKAQEERLVGEIEKKIRVQIAVHTQLEKEWTGISFSNFFEQKDQINPHTERKEELQRLLHSVYNKE